MKRAILPRAGFNDNVDRYLKTKVDGTGLEWVTLLEIKPLPITANDPGKYVKVNSTSDGWTLGKLDWTVLMLNTTVSTADHNTPTSDPDGFNRVWILYTPLITEPTAVQFTVNDVPYSYGDDFTIDVTGTAVTFINRDFVLDATDEVALRYVQN